MDFYQSDPGSVAFSFLIVVIYSLFLDVALVFDVLRPVVLSLVWLLEPKNLLYVLVLL